MDLTGELAECHYWFARHLLAGDSSRREAGLAQLDLATKLWQLTGMVHQLPRAESLRNAS